MGRPPVRWARAVALLRRSQGSGSEAEVAPRLQRRVLGELDRGGGGLRSAATVCRISREGEDAGYFIGVELSSWFVCQLLDVRLFMDVGSNE